MKTVAEVYEVILATARRQVATSAQGKALCAIGNYRGTTRDMTASEAAHHPILASDDLDMLLALIMGNVASYVTLTSEVDDLKAKILMLAEQCAAIGNTSTLSGDVNALWIAKQLREIVGAA